MPEDPSHETEPLDHFWAIFEAPEPIIAAQQAAWWPPGHLNALIAAGLVAPTTMAAQAACPSCPDGHVEEVQIERMPDGRLRYVIPCPESLRVEIDAELLQQWQPDFGLFARRLKESLKIDGRVRSHVPERLFRLGAVTWPKPPREVFLARGLVWPDAAHVIEKIPAAAAKGPIVLVGSGVPQPSAWPAFPPVIIPLPSILSLTMPGATCHLDTHLLTQLVAEADHAAAAYGAMSDAALKRRVDHYTEQRVSQGGTTDMIAALRSQGFSLREMEEEMKRRGVEIDHSTIARMIKNVLHVNSAASSKSIIRHRSSQPRERHGRPIPDAQPRPGE